jgi:pentatricopeptide repeat protein
MVVATTSTSTNDGNEAIVATWRAEKYQVATPAWRLKVVIQSLFEGCTFSCTDVVEEIVQHIGRHSCMRNATVAAQVVGAFARFGGLQAMEEMERAIIRGLGILFAPEVNEAMLEAYAAAGHPDKLSVRLETTRSEGGILTSRCHNGIIRGLLRRRLATEALYYAKDMLKSGHPIPKSTSLELYKLFAKLGRIPELLENCPPEVAPTVEASKFLFDACFHRKDTDLALRLDGLFRESNVPLAPEALTAFLRLLAGAGDSRALPVWRQLLQSGIRLSEELCAAVLVSCAEAKFESLALQVEEHLRATARMSAAAYTALMKLYASSGMHTKGCDLYDSLVSDGVEPDQAMCQYLINFALTSKRTNLAKKLSERLPKLNIHTCMKLLRVSAQERDVPWAFSLFEKAVSTGAAADTCLYNALLDVCSAAGAMTRARGLLAEMTRQGKTDVISYNTILKGLALQGDVRGAQGLLVEMEDAGFMPNDISYNVLINMAVSCGKITDAWATIDKMVNAGVHVDQYTVSTMLKACRKSSYHVRRVFALIDQSGMDISVDEVLLNTVLEACVCYQEKTRMETILRQVRAGHQSLSAHTYGLLIRAYSALGHLEHCREMWEEMVETRQLAPTQVALGCILDALVTHGKPDEAAALMNQWRCRVPPNLVMYSTLIKGFAKHANAERTRHLLEAMRIDGVQKTTMIYNAVIDVHARIGKIGDVLKLVDQMREDQCEIDDFTRSLIAKCLCAKGELKQAAKFYDRLRTGPGNTGNTIVFNTLLDGCVRQNDFEAADELLTRINSVDVSNVTLGTIVKLWGRRRLLDKAFDDVEILAKRHRITVNTAVKNCLLSACVLNGDADRAIGVFAELQNQDGGAGAKAYGQIISALARANRFELAVALTEEGYGLSRRRVGFAASEMEPSVLACLTKALSKAGLMASLGVPLLMKLQTAGIQPSDVSLDAGRLAPCSRERPATGAAPRPRDR